jgi:hypothetical protein
MPNYDGFYFAGVLLCVVGAGLLQYQSYGGKVRALCMGLIVRGLGFRV